MKFTLQNTNRRKSAVRTQQQSLYKRKGLQFGPVSLGFITVFLFSLVSLFYLAQSNQITTKGYVLQDLDREKSKVVSENERLQVEAARLESLTKVSEKAGELSMTPTKTLQYFEDHNSALVKK
ncbi:MAG: hypothetical protein WC045_03795 [Patescibacteria group bacterium]